MKAVLALAIIYVGTFFLAIQGASQNPVNAAQQSQATQDQPAAAPATAIDPAKEADIRSLLELIGAHDQIQEGVNTSSEQFREKLEASMPNNERGQMFVTSFIEDYQKKFDLDSVTQQLVAIYDKHYSDDDIKTLLQFYGSPVGQKVAAQSLPIAHEIQAASRAAANKAAKEALQEMRAQYPQLAQSARLGNGNRQRRWQGRGEQSQTQQANDQPNF
ncbi:MAG TPA: DUF2059 domain-containing protein [Candidatus Acidoferrum sp.]|nr:DUF2059 domain-containing protein [Candidatus Acidoferrum sp.]